MSAVEAIKTIVSAEQNARQIVDDARKKSAEMKRQAGLQIQQIHARTVESAKKEAEHSLTQAEIDAQNESREFLERSEKTLSQEIGAARTKVGDAVEAVVKLVLGGT